MKHVRLAESIGDIESDKNLLQSVVDKVSKGGYHLINIVSNCTTIFDS